METAMDERAASNRKEMVERIARAIPKDGVCEPLPGLQLYRSSRPYEAVYGVTDPCFCVIAQGSKVVMVGDRTHRYDPAQYLLATVELPSVSHLVDISEENPYLSFRLVLDSALVSSMMVETGIPSRTAGDANAISVSPLSPDLLDVSVRLLRLLESPTEARILEPMLKREIIFRLLQGEQGDRLRHVAVLGGHAHRIARAVQRLQEEFNRPLRMEDLAEELGMSPSGFYRQFKEVTAMSPLQFQKQIRLQEARRLMLGEDLDAASAGFRVGYEDVSQFTREYKRHFGEPPMRDVSRLRAQARPQTIATAI
ncbi:AraC family transcriptional regulator [bacterium]|nr:MAG: AraC family transcriptional regulator [bacterium]